MTTSMRTPHSPLVARLLAVALLTAGCSSAQSVAVDTSAPTTSTTTSTTSTTTSTSTTTTSTTVPELPVPLPPPAPRFPEPEILLGTIEIPALGVSKNLYEGVTLTTLDRGPGHWPGTAMPGQYGNAVIGGHRTSHDKPFRDVDQLVAGDEIIYTTADGRFVYIVDEVLIIDPTDIWIIDQEPGYITTLFACHPPGSTRQRIVVRATLSDA